MCFVFRFLEKYWVFAVSVHTQLLNPPPLFRDLDQRYVQGSGREDRKFSPDFLDCTQLQYSGTQLHDIALGYNLLPTTWLVLGYNCSVFRREIAYYKVNFQKFRLRRYLQCIFDSRIATAPSINVKTKIWARRRRKKIAILDLQNRWFAREIDQKEVQEFD